MVIFHQKGQKSDVTPQRGQWLKVIMIRSLLSKIKSSSFKPTRYKNFPSHAYAVVTLFHTNGSLAGPTRLHPQGKGGSR